MSLCSDNISMRFRFHTGSIKSRGGGDPFSMLRRFDSILVRLKDHASQSISSTSTAFRFHTGSIKSQNLGINSISNIISFDSILVRLKAHGKFREMGK